VAARLTGVLTAGWIAHAMEEYAKNAPLRPRTVYTGPVTAAARE
jgi:citrate synthase